MAEKMLVVVFLALVAGSLGFPNDHTDVFNFYVDWIVDLETTNKQNGLEPFVTNNFEPVNSRHRDISVRFVRTNVTGLEEIRREGDCDATRSTESDTLEIVCDLFTELTLDCIVNVTYRNETRTNVSATALFTGVKGPLTLTLRNGMPLSAVFSPRFDRADLIVGGSRDCDGNSAVCLEVYTKFIRLFEYTTQKVFAKYFLDEARRVEFFPN